MAIGRWQEEKQKWGMATKNLLNSSFKDTNRARARRESRWEWTVEDSHIQSAFCLNTDAYIGTMQQKNFF
ncbi:unnamed protein product [Dovyalis caffra]|uniref:Uncharacterized protein n=1 Tax=Dovyalis caffra TaxID=77055 RepID=A0AAV1QZL3_9ROSI|nr:unnamed protein product [Dovyalis caffra]